MQSANGNEAQVQRKALTEEQINRFWIDGYLTIGKILEEDEIELLRREYDYEFERARKGQNPRFRNLSIEDTDDVEAKNQAESQMLQIMQMCEYNIHFRRLLYDDRILDMVEDLIGPNIQLFHDQALFKPAHHGGPVHWHQDNAYWKCSPPNLVSCWLTLDDVDIHNGAMQFIPGSHFQSVSHEDAADDSVLLDYGDNVDKSRAAVIALPAGGVTLHHCQTLHYTAPNVTDNQRRAFAIHFMTPGTKSLREMQYLEVSFERPVLRMRV
ncbi:MAG: phytanoyl-CoA dioxygenase family protein [Caldilineaceae bacterium SB0668_bin_21]|nr:phytanoyl-CoA dioxygenase family protein [Caldilineaceae bacterium SB0668_bin_21]MYC20513.1 phytanoyl-CoA dioxygenase family protein [Caldilineaceae bacterium SB0662_bin_25]